MQGNRNTIACLEVAICKYAWGLQSVSDFIFDFATALISYENVLTRGVGSVIIVPVRGQLAQLVRAPR